MTTPPLESLLAQSLGSVYAVQRELGGGGMSRVFHAHERALDRDVVIKVLPPELAAGMNVERFRREIQLAAKLQHPHIVPVLTAGQVNGLPYFTMPYVEGRSLRELLASGEPIAIPDAMHILRNVASALAYAHAHGVVHRDIKPDNVLLSGGAAIVTDFGIAKAVSSARTRTGEHTDTLTLIGTSLGTPAYMAPEQAAGDPSTDHRADLYAFGVMAYEIVSGRPTFAASTPHALLAAQMSEVPPPLDTRRAGVPRGLAEIVKACLEKDPSRRPADAAAIVRALDASAERSGGARASGLHGRRAAFLVAAGVVVALGAYAGVRALRGRGSVPTPPAAAAVPRSIAVLPLVNESGNPRDDYFSDGMADELTTALDKVSGLRVASRTSAFALRHRSLTVQEIGKALNVGAVLEGTVRRDGDRLRVTAELANTADGLTIWSDTYEREMKDVFHVQDDITQAIVGALRVALGGARPAAARRGTSDLQAYDLYLRGRYYWSQRGAASLRTAAGYFQRAIDRDPSYADAYAGLADATALLPIYGDTPLDSVLPGARRAAERALMLDSTLAEAHTTLGLLLKSTGDWGASAREFQHAIALNPSYATAHQWYAEVLMITDQVEPAIDEMERAEQLDPLSPVIAAELSYCLALAGRFDDAHAAGVRAQTLDPALWTSYVFPAWGELFAHHVPEAVRGLDTAVRLDPNIDAVRGSQAYAYAVAGFADSARGVLRAIEPRALRPGGSPFGVALGFLGLGERDSALAWLARAADRRDPWLYAASLQPVWYDPIRGDRRFEAIRRSMGLSDAGDATSVRHAR